MGKSRGHPLVSPTLSWPHPNTFSQRWIPVRRDFNLKPRQDSIGKPDARESTLLRILRRRTALNHKAAKHNINVSSSNIQIKGQLGRGGLALQRQMTIITAEIQENWPRFLRRPIAQVGLFLAVQ